MSIPREVWISHETANLAIYQEFDAQADVVALSNVALTATGGVSDGQTFLPGTIVLTANQTTPSERGLWLVNNSGGWTALSPFQPTLVLVLNGDANTNTKWNLSAPNTYTQVTYASYIGTPIRTEIYCQNLTINSKSEVKKSGQPGARSKDTVVIPDGVDIQMTAYFERKSEQWTPFLKSTIRYRLEFSLVNAQYASNENDDLVYRNCSATDQKITRQDDKVVETVLALDAEYEE